MNKKWLPLAIVGGVVVLLVIILISGHNSLVNKAADVDNSWAQVDSVLQRRADLIPNLVETVKGYAAHEDKIFTEVAEARAKLAGAKGPTEAAAASGALDGALGRLLAISEAYPDLKANANFIALQDELAGSENRIAVERKRYNDAVREYDAAIARFPGNLFAGMFGFAKRDYFQAEAGAKEVPKVKF